MRRQLYLSGWYRSTPLQNEIKRKKSVRRNLFEERHLKSSDENGVFAEQKILPNKSREVGIDGGERIQSMSFELIHFRKGLQVGSMGLQSKVHRLLQRRIHLDTENIIFAGPCYCSSRTRQWGGHRPQTDSAKTEWLIISIAKYGSNTKSLGRCGDGFAKISIFDTRNRATNLARPNTGAARFFMKNSYLLRRRNSMRRCISQELDGHSVAIQKEKSCLFSHTISRRYENNSLSFWWEAKFSG